MFHITDGGTRLARALDAQLLAVLGKERYEFLCAVDNDVIDSASVGAFVDAWHLDKPTREERVIFLSHLYQTDRLTHDDADGRRTAALELTISTLAATGGDIGLDALRSAMAAPADEALEPIDPAVESARIRWRVLLVQQAQRLAVECLFGWMERCIWDDGARGSTDVARLMLGVIKRARSDWNAERLLGVRVDHYRGDADVDTLFRRARIAPEVDVVRRARSLETLAASAKGTLPMPDELVADAFDLLALCAVYAEHFEAHPLSGIAVASAPAHRLPLHRWALILRQHRGRPFSALLERFIETSLVSQHLEHFHAELPYPAWRICRSHSPAANCSSRQPMVAQRSVTVRLAALLSRVLSLAKTCSMGL